MSALHECIEVAKKELEDGGEHYSYGKLSTAGFGNGEKDLYE